MKKNIENRPSKPTYIKIYNLTTPYGEKIEFIGKEKLEIYLQKINETLKFKSRINCDKLIKEGCLKGYLITNKKR